MGASELEALWPRALDAMDQPSIDGFNTFLVSLVAREAGLKVVLSGLGGDELFGSYPSFRDVPRWTRWAARGSRVPGLARLWPVLAGGAPQRPKLKGFFAHGGALAGAYFLRRGLFLPEELPELVGPERAAEGLAAYDPVADAERALVSTDDAWVAVHKLESTLYLRNQLLRDADWAAMAHSVELRVPLVDARLRAALARGCFEPSRSHGKASLVRPLAPLLPAELFEKPKTGFGVPRPGAAWSHPGLASRALARELLAGLSIPLPRAREARSH
jgi:asparagine synthase (glutamine-hydrolysing)